MERVQCSDGGQWVETDRRELVRRDLVCPSKHTNPGFRFRALSPRTIFWSETLFGVVSADGEVRKHLDPG